MKDKFKIFFLMLVVTAFSGCVTKTYKTQINNESTYQISSAEIVKKDKGIIVAKVKIDEIWKSGYIIHDDITSFDPFFLLNGGLRRGKITDTLRSSHPHVKKNVRHCVLSEFENNLKVMLIGKPLDESKQEVTLPIKSKHIRGNLLTVDIDESILSSNPDKDIYLKIKLLNHNTKSGFKNSIKLLVKSSTGFMY